MSGDPRTDVTRLLDEWDRYTERVSADLVYASETQWNALLAAVRAGLALADVAEGVGLAVYADRIRAALTAPLEQPTTDEEGR